MWGLVQSSGVPVPTVRPVPGQHSVELAVVFGVVVAALMGMQVYAKRSLQARYKSVIDGAAQAGATSAALTQYEPYYTYPYLPSGATQTSAQGTTVHVTYAQGGAVTREFAGATTVEVDPEHPPTEVMGFHLANDDDW